MSTTTSAGGGSIARDLGTFGTALVIAVCTVAFVAGAAVAVFAHR